MGSTKRFYGCLSYKIHSNSITRSSLLLSKYHSNNDNDYFNSNNNLNGNSHSNSINKQRYRHTSLFSNSNSNITTPIYYVNGLPHLGHAYTSTVCDVLARFQRLDGREVFFLTGTDEHGQKVEQSAVLNKKTPIEFANEVSDKFRNLAIALDLSYDDFIRTTEDRHKEGVSYLWKKLEENNQIYLGAYEGWYSIRDEAFYSEDELVDGKAPTGAEVSWVKEESYFFKLSEWTEPLLKFYEDNPDFIGPKGRRNEVISFVSQEGGLKDLSISRTTFSWGIPVPGNEKHVVYVWLDALANYITALGYPNDNMKKQFWPATLHIVGKDILRFHAVFWPAFLLAAGLEAPKRVYAHGWWTKDGEKMSKSIGNVLDPFQLLDLYGKDYVRYFLVAEVPFGNDGDFTHEAFCFRINSDLANDLGNLAQRCLSMIQKNCDSKIPQPGPLTSDDEALLKASYDMVAIARQHASQQNMKQMCESIINVARLGNKYIDVQAPWTLRKTDFARMQTVLYVLTESVRRMAIVLQPVMPTSCSTLLDQIGCSSEWRTIESIASMIPVGTSIGTVAPVFPKIEPYIEEKKNDNNASSSSSVTDNLTKEEIDKKIRLSLSLLFLLLLLLSL